MRTVENLERMLADEFRSGGDLALDSEKIISGVRRRHQRRVVLTGAAAVVAVALAGGVAVAATGLGDGNRPAPGASAQRPLHTALLGAHFRDPTHGYALWHACAPSAACDLHWLTTSDGGRSWQRGTPPPVPPIGGDDPHGEAPVMTALPGGAVVVDEFDETKPTYVRWFSDDDGRTWTKLSWKPERTVTSLPEGGALRLHTLIEDSDVGRMAVVNPDGTAAWLDSNLPRYDKAGGLTDLVTEGSDGSLWFAPPYRTGKKPVYHVSHDRGANWTAHESPVALTAYLLTNDGRTAYAAAQDTTNGPDFATSTDGGDTWSPVIADTAEPTTNQYALLADGTLMRLTHAIDEEMTFKAVFRSTDGGDTFQPVKGAPKLTRMHRAGALLVGQIDPVMRDGGADQPTRFYLSADGVDWREVIAPE